MLAKCFPSYFLPKLKGMRNDGPYGFIVSFLLHFLSTKQSKILFSSQKIFLQYLSSPFSTQPNIVLNSDSVEFPRYLWNPHLNSQSCQLFINFTHWQPFPFCPDWAPYYLNWSTFKVMNSRIVVYKKINKEIKKNTGVKTAQAEQRDTGTAWTCLEYC